MERRSKVRFLPAEINIQPAAGLGEHGGLLLLMHRIQGAGKVLLPLEPEAGQACVVSGQQDAAQRRLIVLCIDHRLSDFKKGLSDHCTVIIAASAAAMTAMPTVPNSHFFCLSFAVM